jgi:predicted transcriptional regulator
MLEQLPPRERQIVDTLYACGRATVAEVCAALPVELSASAVRAMLTRLTSKGFVTRHRSDRGFVYAPAVPEATAKRSALRQIVKTFFKGSHASAATALLGLSDKLSEEEIDELERLIAAARKEQRR